MNFSQYSAELRRRLGFYRGGLVVLQTVASTQQTARRLVDEYLREDAIPPSATFVAWEQSAGRGRQGRSWSSPAGQGVYVSLVRPIGDLRDAQKLPLQVGVALCEALNVHLGNRCRLKWPNDLYVSDAKLGGLLIDLVAGEEGGYALIGFGINHHGALPRVLPTDAAPAEATPTTSLEKEGARPEPAALATELIVAVDEALSGSLSAAIEKYRALSLHRLGDEIRCRIGEEFVEGRFAGFDEHGFLRLDLGSEERVLTTGEIFFQHAEERV